MVLDANIGVDEFVDGCQDILVACDVFHGLWPVFFHPDPTLV